MSWTQAISIEDLKAKGRALFRQDEKQILLMATDQGFFALDNRCPHQGYPLKVGTLDDGCTLTCDWHNWKFDLETGACSTGQDAVRVYPHEVRDGDLWIDLSDPDPKIAETQGIAKVLDAVARGQYGRTARELARLAQAQVDFAKVWPRVLTFAHPRLEWGTTHATAALADWIELLETETDPVKRIAIQTEALDHFAFDCLRHPEYPYPEGVAEAFDPEAFEAAIEAEDQGASIRQLRAGLQQGPGIEAVLPSLRRAALAHYNDFGHSLIYLEKCVELAKGLEADQLSSLFEPLVRSLVFATREDRLPEFRGYPKALEAGLSIQLLESGTGQALSPPPATLSVEKAMDWVLQALGHTSPELVFEGLLETLARQLSAFEVERQDLWEVPSKDHVGWLDFSHALTMADALRKLAPQDRGLWVPGLLQLACFLGRNQRHVDRDRLASGREDPGVELFESTREALFDHGQALPIFSAHLLKTRRAVLELCSDRSEATQAELRKALATLFEGPLKAKHVRRTAYEAARVVGLKLSV